MPKDLTAAREAAAVPEILFGPYGRTVAGYRPAAEQLALAAPARWIRSDYQPVAGPYLRRAHTTDSRSQTGIVGVSLSTERATGRRFVRVRLGATCRRFAIDTLGESEALRRAIALRREHLTQLALANAAIIAARASRAGVHPEEPAR